MKYDNFAAALTDNANVVSAYIFEQAAKMQAVKPKIIEDCTMSYIKGGGKMLRPTVLILSSLAVGGTREAALPAAAAVELFHTWTLVHDDIIDNDDLRRGVETVHVAAAKYAQKSLGLPPQAAEKYGRDTAILTGDIQHGWSISMLSRNLPKEGVKPEIALHLISLMQVEMLRTLLEGEMLDVDFSVHYEIDDLEDEQILDMLWKKTGVFYEFCGLAGAMIGKNTVEYDEQVNALKDFCSLCGTAFQVRDDILGLVGNKKKMGKAVGADIREGKKTLLVKEALRNASEAQNHSIRAVLGNTQATPDEIANTTQLIIDLGGVEKAHSVAMEYINKAMPKLDCIPQTPYKDLLYEWASYMVDRGY
jgi:geranylgeranyl diphosphate synthase type I